MLNRNKRTIKKIIKKTIKNSYSRKKTKKYGNIQTQNGGGILNSIRNSIYKPVAGKNLKSYFPGEKLINSFTSKSSPEGAMTVIFKYNNMTNPEINIDNVGKTVLNITDIDKEPYIKLKYTDRYIIMMYENIKNNKKKIYWLAEYSFKSKSKSIFFYKSPLLKNGRVHTLIIELYVYPKHDISKLSLSPSLKLTPQGESSRKIAYIEFLKYMIANKLKSVSRKSFYAQRKGKSIGTNIFSLLSPKTAPKKDIYKYHSN
uniref:Uncharacterized protein n=1 Tax=viral metagenome TaxID=1070528 RepID=A0A6C0EYQ6_9ZZZZ